MKTKDFATAYYIVEKDEILIGVNNIMEGNIVTLIHPTAGAIRTNSEVLAQFLDEGSIVCLGTL